MKTVTNLRVYDPHSPELKNLLNNLQNGEVIEASKKKEKKQKKVRFIQLPIRSFQVKCHKALRLKSFLICLVVSKAFSNHTGSIQFSIDSHYICLII